MPATQEGLEALTLNDLRALIQSHLPDYTRAVRSKGQAVGLLVPLLPPPPARAANGVHARMADAVIRVMADANPYRAGSHAHDHFEKARGGITIRDYLAKFPQEEHRKARQWLYNMTKSGHVKTLGGEP